MKKLMPLALLAAVAWVVWKFITKSSGGPGFFDGGNQQIKETWDNVFGTPAGGARSAWDEFWNLHPDVQLYNPATGNPIPDATVYPDESYPIQTAALPPGRMGIEPWLTGSGNMREPAPGQVVTILPYMPGMPGGYPNGKRYPITTPVQPRAFI